MLTIVGCQYWNSQQLYESKKAIPGLIHFCLFYVQYRKIQEPAEFKLGSSEQKARRLTTIPPPNPLMLESNNLANYSSRYLSAIRKLTTQLLIDTNQMILLPVLSHPNLNSAIQNSYNQLRRKFSLNLQDKDKDKRGIFFLIRRDDMSFIPD